MIPSFKPGIVASNSIRKTAASDVTPDAVNWANASSGSPEVTSETKTITGINTTITLTISYTGNEGYDGQNVYIVKNGNDLGLSVSVVNGDQIAFKYRNYNVEGSSLTITITVRNASDGNTVLDTLTLTAVAP